MSAKKSNEDKAKKPVAKKPVAKKKAMVKKEDVVAFDIPVVDPIILDEEQVIDGAKENAQIAKAMSETKSPDLSDETINPNSELIEHIKEIRKNADRMQKIILGNRNIFSASLNDSMNNGRAWLGQLLGAIGTQNPYNVEVKTAFDIPATTDVVKEDKEIAADVREFSLLGSLEATLEAREGISSIKKSIYSLIAACYENGTNGYFKDAVKVNVSITNAWSHYCEARFELGYKLAKLRK